MKLSKRDRVRYFLFPPKCAGCGKLLDLNRQERDALVFCPECSQKWKHAKLEPCACCDQFISNCDNLPRNFKSESGVALLKLVHYKPNIPSYVPNQFIYRIKHANQQRFFDFAAEELQERLSSYLHANGIPLSLLRLAWIPRKRTAIAKDGCDHAAEITKRLAVLIGTPPTPQLILRHGGKEEKTLDHKGRIENMRRTLTLCSDAEQYVHGKVLVIVDDVFTTGSGMAVASDLLHAAGASLVICVVIAKTK